MRAYMVWAGEPEEGACLVFDYTARDAKARGARVVFDWMPDCEWPDLRVRWIKDADASVWNQRKQDGPHVIESPTTCRSCDLWGLKMSADNPELCEGCADYAEHAEFVEGQIVRGEI